MWLHYSPIHGRSTPLFTDTSGWSAVTLISLWQNYLLCQHEYLLVGVQQVVSLVSVWKLPFRIQCSLGQECIFVLPCWVFKCYSAIYLKWKHLLVVSCGNDYFLWLTANLNVVACHFKLQLRLQLHLQWLIKNYKYNCKCSHAHNCDLKLHSEITFLTAITCNQFISQLNVWLPLFLWLWLQLHEYNYDCD
jgi:hypothetical protein